MQKNRLLTGALILFLMIIVSSCGIEKISRKKIKDIDFTVVAEIEMPLEVKQIVEKRKEQPFKVTYSDNQYTYIIIGYGRQNHQGYSIKVNKKRHIYKNRISGTKGVFQFWECNISIYSSENPADGQKRYIQWITTDSGVYKIIKKVWFL